MSMQLGTPGQLAALLGSTAEVIDGEDAELFAIDPVREAAEHLRLLLGLRLAEADDNQGGTPTTTTLQRQTGRGLIEPDLFDRLTRRVACENDLDDSLAKRIIDQALAFLQACADNPHLVLSPSPLVDLGWHTFILHTKEYAEFCARVAGGFVHHHPTDAVNDTCPEVADTAAAIGATGLHVDPDLWACAADCQGRCKKCKSCHQCHGGCHNSP